MKRISNFLVCVAIALIVTCFLFSTTTAKNTQKPHPNQTYEEGKENPAAIMIQQREIKDGLKRMEKKILKKSSQKRYNGEDRTN